jgi:electron transfer flavoprotein alpha subunit
MSAEKILYLAHPESGGTLPRIALEVLAAARHVAGQLDCEFVVGLVGRQSEVSAAADAIADCGAAAFNAVIGDEFGDSRYATDVAALEALTRQTQATLVMAPGTSRFARSAPGAALRLDGRIDTHVTGVGLEGEGPQIERWYYRQRIVARLARTPRPWFWLIDSGLFDPWEGSGGSAALKSLEVPLPTLRTEVAGVESPPAEEQTIRPDAELLFVAGAGWTKKQADGATHVKEAETLIHDFLQHSHASLGSSKSLVDQAGEGQDVISFMTHMNQVGQTGSTPRHPKGLATCCHGEEPHVVGWRFIKERRAVNLDPSCGWAQGKADVLYVADAFEVIRRVNRLLAST